MGKLYSEDGKMIFEGEFIDDQKDGYFGEKKDGLGNGKGILYNNGKILYDGDGKF